MRVHEYQAKNLLRSYGVPVMPGVLVEKLSDTEEAYALLGGTVVVKAQLHAGGRGKAGGIKKVSSLVECQNATAQLLGKQLVTAQTGARGQKIRKLYLEKTASIQKELYLALLLERNLSQLIFIGTSEGGMDIEELAKTSPQKIFRKAIDPLNPLESAHDIGFASQFDLPEQATSEVTALCTNLVQAYLELDASLIEVNPLALTTEGHLIALDCKMTFDENALFRHPELEKLRDLSEENPLELRASSFGLNYISLKGAVGCLVNGAGLAMATMDLIKLAGTEPANFLDVGGSATEEAISEALKLILSDPQVRAVFVNIFGGIMRCDVIASGILHALNEVGASVPLVVRLQGTRSKEAHELLSHSPFKIRTAETMQEGVENVLKVLQTD